MNITILKAITLGLAVLASISTANAGEWQKIDRYQVKEGIVQDTETGLTWMRCSLGFDWDGTSCVGNFARYNWQQALTLSKNFNYAGYSDWRLPSYTELKTLIYCSSGQVKNYNDGRSRCDGEYNKPTILQTVFPNLTEKWFWTASSYAYYDGSAWFVDFKSGYGGYDYKDYSYAVRLVRSGT